ncbi:MAG: hypothetical protein WCK67_09920 [bacterium]
MNVGRASSPLVNQVSFQGKEKPILDRAKKIMQDPVDRQRFYRQMEKREKDFFEKAQVTLEDVPEVIKEDAQKAWKAIKKFFDGEGPKGPGGGSGGGGNKAEEFSKLGNKELVPVKIPVPVDNP